MVQNIILKLYVNMTDSRDHRMLIKNIIQAEKVDRNYHIAMKLIHNGFIVRAYFMIIRRSLNTIAYS